MSNKNVLIQYFTSFNFDYFGNNTLNHVRGIAFHVGLT